MSALAGANGSYIFLPSQIARLVLGYLRETECIATYGVFIEESPHLEELRLVLRQGGNLLDPGLTDMTLSQMLNDYETMRSRLLKELNLGRSHSGPVSQLMYGVDNDNQVPDVITRDQDTPKIQTLTFPINYDDPRYSSVTEKKRFKNRKQAVILDDATISTTAEIDEQKPVRSRNYRGRGRLKGAPVANKRMTRSITKTESETVKSKCESDSSMTFSQVSQSDARVECDGHDLLYSNISSHSNELISSSNLPACLENSNYKNDNSVDADLNCSEQAENTSDLPTPHPERTRKRKAPPHRMNLQEGIMPVPICADNIADAVAMNSALERLCGSPQKVAAGINEARQGETFQHFMDTLHDPGEAWPLDLDVLLEKCNTVSDSLPSTSENHTAMLSCISQSANTIPVLSLSEDSLPTSSESNIPLESAITLLIPATETSREPNSCLLVAQNQEVPDSSTRRRDSVDLDKSVEEFIEPKVSESGSHEVEQVAEEVKEVIGEEEVLERPESCARSLPCTRTWTRKCEHGEDMTANPPSVVSVISSSCSPPAPTSARRDLTSILQNDGALIPVTRCSTPAPSPPPKKRYRTGIPAPSKPVYIPVQDDSVCESVAANVEVLTHFKSVDSTSRDSYGDYEFESVTPNKIQELAGKGLVVASKDMKNCKEDEQIDKNEVTETGDLDEKLSFMNVKLFLEKVHKNS